MKMFVGLVAAMLLTGAAAPSFAKAPAAAKPASASTTDCMAPQTTWHNFGADPFAKTEEEAMRKLPIALGHAVSFGCMPQRIADEFLRQVRENPEGTRLILTPGTVLAFTESGSHPSVNKVIGTKYVGTGLVTGIEVIAWAAKDEETGMTYTWVKPFICFNYSLLGIQKGPPPPPKPPEDDCVPINAFGSADSGAFIHVGFFGAGADDANSVCSAWRKPGETAWRSWKDCRDDCLYEAVIARVRKEIGQNAELTASLKLPVTATGWYQIRVSRKFAESRVQLAVLCYELKTGRMSRGQLVRHDDHHDGTASVFLEKAAIPAAWKKPSRRELYWQFDKNR